MFFYSDSVFAAKWRLASRCFLTE